MPFVSINYSRTKNDQVWQQIFCFVLQVVAKSGKPIPVMILGVLLGRKSYPLKKYLFVLLVVIGVALFMFKDGKSNSSQADSSRMFIIIRAPLLDRLLSSDLLFLHLLMIMTL